MTVAELEAEMSVEEFVEWSIFLKIQQEEVEKARRGTANGKANRPGRI
jgi:hypothetical protein